MKILLVAATITLLLGLFTEDEGFSWIEGASIYFAVAFIALFTSASDYIKNKQFLKLHDEIKNEEVNVIRGQYGLSQPCKVFEVVVGDIILIEAGMRIPADCILVEGMDVTVDEHEYYEDRETIVRKSVSTGENHKENPDPFLLTRSLVLSGSGRAVVCAVGKYSRISAVKDDDILGEGDEVMTPLQGRLEKLAGIFGKWGYFASFVIFVCSCIFMIIQFSVEGTGFLDPKFLKNLVNYFTVAVAVIIVAVPEGMPLAVSLSMAFSIDTMKRDNLLVKKLEAVETMGTVTEICTGKTATLTKNDMSVQCFYTAGQFIVSKTKDTLVTCGLGVNIVTLIKDCIIYNCDSRVEMSDDAKYVPAGNGTEVGMLKFLQGNEMAIQDLIIKRERQGILETNIPFGPIRKRQLVVIRPSNKDQYVRVVVKGAPEYVMPMCNSILNGSGQRAPLSSQENQRILEQEIIAKCAKKGLRTIVYAYKDIYYGEWEQMQENNNNFVNEADRELLERDLTFVAAFGLNDDLRAGVPEAIGKLQDGQITVRMISGDNFWTAVETAKKAGIINPGDENKQYYCMNGREFREMVGGVKKTTDREGNDKWEVMNKANFKKVAQFLRVLARSTPEDKFTLIIGLKELGASVAVTGDGINDVQALKVSNVGFCMGISGCEVAKEAADIIILDDNFTSVFRAAQWGRSIYDNIRKFIQFQFTVNIVTLFTVFLGSVSFG